MKRVLCIILSAALAAGIAVMLGTAGHAITSSDCGIKVVKNKSYNENGKFYMSFNITGGRASGTASGSGQNYASAKLYNSSGKCVVTWSEDEFGEGKNIKRSYGYNYNANLPSGTYTFKLTVKATGWTDYFAGTGYYGTKYSNTFVWSYSINHKQASSVSMKSVELMSNNGSYFNKITFSHSGAKGKVIHMEIYDQWDNRVYKTSGKPISYTSGTYYFNWNGFPSGGGVQCSSGEYTIKYWLNGGSAKQSKYYLSIY